MNESDGLNDELRTFVVQIRQAARLKVLEAMVIHILSSAEHSQPEEQIRANFEKNVRAMEDLLLGGVSDRNPNAASCLAQLLEEARKEQF